MEISREELEKIIKEEVAEIVKEMRPLTPNPHAEKSPEEIQEPWRDILVEKITEMLADGLAFGARYKVEKTDEIGSEGKILIGKANPTQARYRELPL